MKKKESIQKKEGFFSKKKSLAYFMGGFIILLMVASGLNMWKGEETEEYDYNGLKFVKTEQGYWMAYKGNERITLIYHPEELENITIPPNINLISFSQKIYMSTDDIKLNGRAINYFQKKIEITNLKPLACLEDKDEDWCKQLPLKNCDDATQTQAIATFKEAEETKINYQNNCLVMEGTSENLIKAIDKIYFTLKGI